MPPSSRIKPINTCSVPMNICCICSLGRSEEHTSELQSLAYLVCRLLLEKKKNVTTRRSTTISTARWSSRSARAISDGGPAPHLHRRQRGRRQEHAHRAAPVRLPVVLR